MHVWVSNRQRIGLETQTLIDTGFSGDIVVPAIEGLKPYTPGAYATWTIADGSEMLAPIFLGHVHFPELEINQ